MPPGCSAHVVAPSRRVRRAHGLQATLNPLVKLNVAGVQKAAALRNQTWYVRVVGALTLPATCTAGPPIGGKRERPPWFTVAARRTTTPCAQRRPSPNGVALAIVPWK